MVAKLVDRHLGIENAIKNVVCVFGCEPVALVGEHGNRITVDQLEKRDDDLGRPRVALLLLRENALEIVSMRNAPLEPLFAAEEDALPPDHVAQLLLVPDVVGPGFEVLGVEARPGRAGENGVDEVGGREADGGRQGDSAAGPPVPGPSSSR